MSENLAILSMTDENSKKQNQVINLTYVQLVLSA
jgi:hypothetical protein